MPQEDRLIIGSRFADRYAIIGEIGRGGMGSVYRAMPFNDPSQDVAIKVIRRDQDLGPEALLRFQKEASVMSRLHHPNIISFHELGLFKDTGALGTHSSGYYIVMEMATGTNLKEALVNEGRKDLSFFFEVGIQVAAALDYTHGKNIIHRDIKPQNIIVGRPWKEQKGILVKVLDFGIARLAEVTKSDGTSATGESNRDVVGTPMYMAPEQTPFMDAPVDHRVDLYSLGCVLYEILAGKAPFSANSKEKLMRHHVQTAPEPLSAIRPDIPNVIEAIVLKLLAKNPKDRYQSAFGLKADLQKARVKLQKHPRPKTYFFALGLKDEFKSVASDMEMIGRQDEFAELQQAYEEVSKQGGRSRLTVIKGEAGVGKTRLLTQFRTSLADHRIRFVSTSFSRHENNLPFNALANGFNEYLIRVLKSQPREVEELKRKVKTLLGSMALEVAGVVPGLKPYIDTDLELAGLSNTGYNFDDYEPDDPSASEKRFQSFAKGFSDFTRCLAIDNQPVVFIFDDMQWADEKSIELIDTFFSHNNSQRFFMIIGYRPLGTLESEAFKNFLEKFRKLRRRFHEISLTGFDRPSVRLMAGAMMGSSATINDELLQYIYNKTGGNPMHLAEVLKVLVASEKIYLSTKTGMWTYDIDDLRGSKLILDSVDMTLSRIQTYERDDREILEIAATIGMTFQFGLLMINENIKPNRVTAVLQMAIDEGLIHRSPDDEEFKHLGKTYTFTHRMVREEIRDAISDDRKALLHVSIAKNIEKLLPTPAPKTIFTLAHHVNRAMEYDKAKLIEADLISLGIRYNMKAGKEASVAGSWISAESYYKNAYELLKSQPNDSAQQKEIATVIEKWADINVNQARYDIALRMYKRLFKMQLNYVDYVAILNKAINLQLVCGMKSIASKQLVRGLKAMGLDVPSYKGWQLFKAWLHVAGTVLFPSVIRARLGHLEPKATQFERMPDQVDYAQLYGDVVGLYHHGQEISLIQYKKMWILFHDLAFKLCMNKDVASHVLLMTIGHRALLLSYLGFRARAYQLIDMAMVTAERLVLNDIYAQLQIMRIAVLDQYQGRGEENIEILRQTLPFISRESDRSVYGMAHLLRMASDFFCGKLKEVVEVPKEVGKLLPISNGYSAKIKAFQLFALLLMGARDRVVREGEAFIKQREAAGSSSTDIMQMMIQILVANVKGEKNKTRRLFYGFVVALNHSQHSHYYFPFESDLIHFFLLIFPDIFMHENSTGLMRNRDHLGLLAMLAAYAKRNEAGGRAVAALIESRYAEGIRSHQVKKKYFRCLFVAKMDNQHLVQTFANLWFGRLLYVGGNRHRQDYIKKAHADSVAASINVVTAMTERVMKELKIGYQTAFSSVVRQQAEDQTEKKVSDLVYANLDFIRDIHHDDQDLNSIIGQGIQLLRKYHKFVKITCVLIKNKKEDLEVFYSSGDNVNFSALLDYVAPYINVRSSLFLTMNDAPWYVKTNENTGVTSSAIGIAHPEPDADDSEDYDVDKTTAEMATIAIEATQPAEADGTHPSTLNASESSKNETKQRAMNIIIPLRYETHNCGVLFVEGYLVNDQQSSNRHELDLFGAQLGYWVFNKKRENLVGLYNASEHNRLSKPHPYDPGEYCLEEVSWLNLWTKGKLRRDRESTWYLGLSLGSDDYLLVYLRLNGPELQRMRLSSILWYHLTVLRSLALATGTNTLQMAELREELMGLLRARSAVSNLDNMSLTFTFFSRSQRETFSGHFGPSRPLVMFEENEVTPNNEFILELSNSRTLRYWEVRAPFGANNVYVLTHDSSKIDEVFNSNQDKTSTQLNVDRNAGFAFYQSRQLSSTELEALFTKQLIAEHVPRYYVAAAMKAEAASTSVAPAESPVAS